MLLCPFSFLTTFSFSFSEEGDTPKGRDNKTKRRPQEDKKEKNKEEWKRKDYNHVRKDLHLRPTQDTFKKKVIKA